MLQQTQTDCRYVWPSILGFECKIKYLSHVLILPYFCAKYAGYEAEYFTSAFKWNSNTSQLEALSSYHFGLSESIHHDFVITLLQAVSFYQVLKTVICVIIIIVFYTQQHLSF
jgi:hypothetical protein